jgi:hypothetical protein
MILDIKNTDSIVLRTDPDIAKAIFEKGVYFIAANVTIRLHVINGLMASGPKANCTRTAGGNPDIAFAIFENAAEIAKIGNAGIGKVDVGKLLSIAIEQL